MAALRRIDAGLSVEWIATQGLWAVCHDVQFQGNFEAEVDATIRLLREQFALTGTAEPDDLEEQAMRAVRARRIVFYVTDEDDPGVFRQIDHRDVKKVERMDWLRRELSIADWKELVRVRAETARQMIAREKGDVWECIKRDKVFASQIGDILWGSRPLRSVSVPAGIERTVQ